MVLWYLPGAVLQRWTAALLKTAGEFFFPVPVKPAEIPASDVLQLPEPAVAIPPSPEMQREFLLRAYFRHSQVRLTERYGLELTPEVWNGWMQLIRERQPMALYVCAGQDEAEIWRVWFAHRVVYAVFRDDAIVTVLPDRGQFRAAVQKALNERMKKVKEQKIAVKKTPVNQVRSISRISAPVSAPAASRPVPAPRLTREEENRMVFLAAMKGGKSGMSAVQPLARPRRDEAALTALRTRRGGH